MIIGQLLGGGLRSGRKIPSLADAQSRFGLSAVRGSHAGFKRHRLRGDRDPALLMRAGSRFGPLS